ncbi:unnamed protein product, partial [Porites lobata]
EKGRREKLKNIWARKCCNVKGDGGVSTKKKCIEDGSCNFRGRRPWIVVAERVEKHFIYQTAMMRLSVWVGSFFVYYMQRSGMWRGMLHAVCKRTAHVDKPSSRGTKHSEGQRKRSWRSD